MNSKFTENLFFKFRQIKYWTMMALGKSYYHQPQNLGRIFVPSELKGYFNDLTGKTLWKGLNDQKGIPLIVINNGQRKYFPILIVQKALGHYDLWLLKKDDRDKIEFLKLCNWLIEHQDEKGGWNTWENLNLELSSKYSAMTQGEAISALLRAWKFTNDSKFLKTAQKAVALFQIPVERGGVTYFIKDDIFFEEAPSRPRNTVLNGWIFALFGLYDYNLIFNDQKIKRLFNQSIESLIQFLPTYDTGYWSYYDSQRHLASPFYHNLHIHQLEALYLITQNSFFKKHQKQWLIFQHKFLNKFRAFILKVFEKLIEPTRVVIIK